MSPNLTPDPYRHDCRFFTEQDIKAGAICGACGNPCGGFYYTPELKEWWE